MEPADVLIVGGGFTGAALASALADGQRRILVLEARAGKSPRFAGELIHPYGVEVLEHNGLLEELEEVGGTPVRGFAVVRSAGAAPTLLPYHEIPGARPFGFAIEHHAMVARLRRVAASRPGVTLLTGQRVVDVLRDGGRVVGVRTESGEEHRAALTLVAEGRHAKLRGLLGLEGRAHLHSFTAAVLAKDTSLPAAGYGHIFLGAWGPILAYPIGGGEVRMCLDLPADGDKGTAVIADRLRREYAPVVPQPLRQGMLTALDEGRLEMAANWAIRTDRCTVPGAALVGDSAGCSHPLTAAGMTICLSDLRILQEELAKDSGSLGAVDGALDRYQTRRYRFVRAREILTDALYDVFRGAEPSTRAIRQGIFRYWDSAAKHRGASMALLSGYESGLPSFLSEYLRVVSSSVAGTARGQIDGPATVGRLAALRALAGKATEQAGRVWTSVREGHLR